MTQVPKSGDQPFVTSLLAFLARLALKKVRYVQSARQESGSQATHRVSQVVTVVVLLDDFVTQSGVETRVGPLFRASTEANRDGLDGGSDDAWVCLQEAREIASRRQN